MAKKGKIKISKLKRNNHTTNKMKKHGMLKLQRHRQKVQKQKQPSVPDIEYSSESAGSGDEWADMLDEEEQKYIMKRLAKQPSLLSNVPEKETEQRKAPKRKRLPKPQKQPSDSGADIDTDLSDEEKDIDSEAGNDSDESEIEEKYEKEQADRPVKKIKALLPIKTKEGILERTEEVDESETEQEEDSPPNKKPKPSESEAESDSEDSGLEGTPDEGSEGTVSAVQLMAARRDKLAHDKLRIGALCSSLLESPEKKIKNLYPILYLMEERLKDGCLNLISVRKLATLSAYEVFKDILPDYMIRHQDYSNVKLKKDTLALYKYEKELLEFYKRYLQRLEKSAGLLRKKRGDTRKLEDATVSLALVSLQCMSGLLVARPNFNYATNIAQSVVPFLDCKESRAREIVTEACVQVFAEDKKGDITLTIVRLINQLVKRRGEHLNPLALDCLLSLKIRDVDMDAESDIKHKKKQEEKHKKRIVNLSKREKKRAKKLKEVERELLETQAQESEVSRRKQLTEVTKTVFHIYFRLLKSAPGSKLLAAALKGISKFTHVINLEYYSDLVSILSRLISNELVESRQRLLCCGCVLALLAGAGDALNVDPALFHGHLYNNMLAVHAGKNHEDALTVVEAVWQISCRARRVSPHVLQAFAKRLATLALQLQHHGALACLIVLRSLIQQSKAVSSLLEWDNELGSGRFDPLLPSVEHCGAQAARLAELALLARHYHPAVRAAAALHTPGPPADLNNITPMQAFKQYDSTQMSFKPSIPAPKRTEASKGKSTHTWAQPELKELCERIENNVRLSMDDCSEFIKINDIFLK